VSFYVSTATFFLLHCDEWDRVVALPRHNVCHRSYIIAASSICAISVSDFKLCNLIIMFLSNLFLKKIKIKVNFFSFCTMATF
jgi:hypothetical protein